MEKELVWTAEAKEMLMQIFDGLVSKDSTMAASVIREVYARAQVLLKTPEIGWPIEAAPTNRIAPKRDVRYIRYGHYRIAYEVLVPDCIVILTVFTAPDRSEPAAFGTVT